MGDSISTTIPPEQTNTKPQQDQAKPAEGQPAPATDAAPAQQAPLLAGKYKDRAALTQATVEAAKQLGLDGLVRTEFEDDNAAVEAYKKLESKLGSAKTKDDTKPDEIKIETPQSTDDVDIPTLLKSVGLESADITKEFMGNGKLTDEQYAKFAAKGHPKTVVNAFLKGQVAEAKLAAMEMGQAVNKATEVAGGKEALDNKLVWASSNLSESERTRLNVALANPATIESAIRELNDRYREASGAPASSARQAEGTPSGGSSSRPYTSAKEIADGHKAAIKKYGSLDKATEHLARLAATPQHVRSGVNAI